MVKDDIKKYLRLINFINLNPDKFEKEFLEFTFNIKNNYLIPIYEQYKLENKYIKEIENYINEYNKTNLIKLLYYNDIIFSNYKLVITFLKHELIFTYNNEINDVMLEMSNNYYYIDKYDKIIKNIIEQFQNSETKFYKDLKQFFIFIKQIENYNGLKNENIYQIHNTVNNKIYNFVKNKTIFKLDNFNILKIRELKKTFGYKIIIKNLETNKKQNFKYHNTPALTDIILDFYNK